MIHICISSNTGYEQPTELLLRSLSGAQSVTVFQGKSDEGMSSWRGRVCIHTPHNRFDYTALVGVAEHRLFDPCDWILLLHSTVEMVDLDYLLSCAEGVLSPELDAVSLTGNGFCNIAFYSVAYLHSVQHKLLSELGSIDKAEAIRREGCIFRDSSWGARTAEIQIIRAVDTGRKEPVYGGVNRLIEEWTAYHAEGQTVLFRKNKACFGQHPIDQNPTEI